MDKSVRTTCVVPAYYIAGSIWGDLKKLEGIHWNCGEGKEAKAIGWACYDARQHPNPPPLNRRFKRLLFTDENNDYLAGDRLAVLKMLRFYMHSLSQGLVVVTNSILTTEELRNLCTMAGFPDVKRVHDGAVLIHKY